MTSDTVGETTVVLTAKPKTPRKTKKEPEPPPTDPLPPPPEEPRESHKEKNFTASQGRLRKLFTKSGLSGRISKDVFEMLDKKIKCLVEQRVKALVVKDKRIIFDEECDDKEKVYELPITPFREFIKAVIKKEYDISRVSPDISETLHYLVEKDVVKLCQYAQDIMKNSTRKTLFANDIEVASRALLKD
jgi:Histones H3 and H4